jgi:hypothetical protein
MQSLPSAWARIGIAVLITDALAIAAAVAICVASGRTAATDVGTGVFLAGILILGAAALPLMGTFQGGAAVTGQWGGGLDARTTRNLTQSLRGDIATNYRFLFTGIFAGLPLVVAGILVTLYA